jgi:hypothetical protein
VADLDAFADDVAEDLMRDAARSVNRLQVKNAVGGHDNLADLDDEQYEAFYAAVLDRIEHAEITIDINGG